MDLIPTDLIFDLLSWLALVSGSFLVLVSGLGLVRLPDFYSRIHAAGITDTMGAGLVLTGLIFQIPLSLVTVKLIMLMVFLALTGPMAAHALAKTAHLHGVTPLLRGAEHDDAHDAHDDGHDTSPSTKETADHEGDGPSKS